MQSLLTAARDRGLVFGHYLGVESSFTVQSPVDMSAEDVRSLVASLPGFVDVSPDAKVRLAATTPNDPGYSLGDQYGIDAINAPDAWDRTTGSSSVVVAVLDSGMDIYHEDLAVNRWRNFGETAGDGIDNDGNNRVDDVFGYDFYISPDQQTDLPDNDPADVVGHGTMVAGIIGAVGNNGTGIVGTAWNCKLLPVKIAGIWDDEVDSSNSIIATAIEYVNGLKDLGANIRVINMSLTTSLDSAVQSAIQAARDRGILVIAAAGNDGAGVDTGWNNGVHSANRIFNRLR